MMLLGGLQGLSASYGKGGQNSIAKDTAHKESTVSAGRTVSIESGKDTDITGSHVKWETLSEEDKEKLQKSIESNSVTYGNSILAKYTIRYYPQMVKEYPEIFEGVKDLGKLKNAYSIAGFIWFYCEKRYENRPDSIGYDTWLEHEIIGGQKD